MNDTEQQLAALRERLRQEDAAWFEREARIDRIGKTLGNIYLAFLWVGAIVTVVLLIWPLT